MAKDDRRKAGDDKSPASSFAPAAPVGAMFLGLKAADSLSKAGDDRPSQAFDAAQQAMDNGDRSRVGVYRASNKKLRGSPYAGITFAKDNQPRFELTDNTATLNKSAVPRSGTTDLANVLNHPKLYQAMPTLKSLQVGRAPANAEGSSFDGETIKLSPRAFDAHGDLAHEAMEHVLHEVQHSVAEREKFDLGGSPKDFEKFYPGDSGRDKRIEKYKLLAGEQEARLTGRQYGHTAAMRRGRLPSEHIPGLQEPIGFDDPIDNHILAKNVEAGKFDRSFIDFQGVKDAASNAFQQLFNKDMADNKPARFRKLDPRQITSDPSTFQFKSGGDNHGVTDRLKGVKSWDNVAAGKAVVFERANGDLVIADGHQRLGLAKRLASEGQKINMDAYVLRERDGWSPRDVYAYAALKNIKESSGQALDMAKVMRERPDLVNGSVPMSDAKVREAANLAKLSKPAFDMVVGGVIKPEYAAQVGARIGETTRHADMLAEMAKANITSAQHAGLYVDQALSAGSIHESQNSLFGEETKTRSLIAERAAVLDKALGSLKSDKRIFALLDRESHTIEEAGNRLSHETNAARASEAGTTAALVERLAKNRGPVSSMLETAALQMAEGKKPQVAARSFVKAVGDALKSGGMRALTGDAPEMHQMVNQNQTSMFSIEPKAAGEHHVWDDKARAASANARKANAKGDDMKQPKSGAAYEIVDRQTKKVVGTAKTLKSAIRSVDRRDNAYGASRYMHRKVESTAGKVRMSIDDGQGDMMPKATTKDKIAAESRKKAAKGRTGDAADHGLFSSSRQQTDIVDRVRRVDDEVKRISAPRKPFANIVRQVASESVAPSDPMKRLAGLSKQEIQAVHEQVVGSKAAARTSKAAMIKAIEQRAYTTGRSMVRKAQTVGAFRALTSAEEAGLPGKFQEGRDRIMKDVSAAIDKVTSGKRGTQNAANLEAINTNRKSRAKAPAKASNLPDPIKVIEARNQTARAHAEIAKALKGTSPGASKQRVAIGLDLVKRNQVDIDRLEAHARMADVARLQNAIKESQTTTPGTPRGDAAEATLKTLTQDVKAKHGMLSETEMQRHEDAKKWASIGDQVRADRERRYLNRMRAGDSQKGDAELRTEALTKPSNGVADRMRAKMNAPKPERAPAADKIAAKPAKRGVRKVAGVLAPIAIGAAMIVASSKAKAEGRDAGSQIKEAAKEGVKGGVTLAGFTVGTAAVTGGLMRAGMTAAKAIPATSVALMGFGAVSEGIAAYRHGEGATGIIKAAAKGAWDMSLPGMAVNTGVAVHDAFNAANTAYRAPAKDSSDAPASGTSGARRGWANPTVQAAAQAAKGRTFSGFTRADLR